MYVVRFNAGLRLDLSKSAASVRVIIDPGIDYVVSASQYAWLKAEEGKAPPGPAQQSIDRVSHLEPKLRNFVANPYGGRGESLVFYAGAGGYGDQLMAAPVVKLIAELGYDVTVITDPGNQPCWYGYPFIKAILTLPLPYATFKLYQHHVMLEQVTNVDEHADQLHPVDAMLNRVGIDPATIGASQKIAPPVLTAAELAEADQFINGNKLALYQLSGSGASRRLPAQVSRSLFMTLAEQVPDLGWVGLYDAHDPAPYSEPLPLDAPVNAKIFSFPSIRQLFAVASKVEIGVGHDSLLSHVMGSFGRPFVGLWGPTRSDLRARYYPRHTPIANHAACPHAPCLRYKTAFEQCPPLAQTLGCCLVLNAVDPAQVVGAVHALRIA